MPRIFGRKKSKGRKPTRRPSPYTASKRKFKVGDRVTSGNFAPEGFPPIGDNDDGKIIATRIKNKRRQYKVSFSYEAGGRWVSGEPVIKTASEWVEPMFLKKR